MIVLLVIIIGVLIAVSGGFLVFRENKAPISQKTTPQEKENEAPSFQEQQSRSQQPQFQPSQSNKISVKSTDAKYKSVSTKPAADPNGAVGASWFKTGQDADIMLSGIDFNNTGGPLLFNHPAGIATDGKRLLLSDRNNNRVLIWNTLPTGNTPPDLVLGQPDFVKNNPGTGLHQLNWPSAVSAAKGKVIVADSYNNRVLIWLTFPTKNGQSADIVMDVPTLAKNIGSQHNLEWPWGVWTDGTKLIIAATSGGKALIWNKFPQQNNQEPNLVLTGKGKMGTPRYITSDGNRLLIWDHNAKVPTGRNLQEFGGAATFVWKSWPTSPDQPFDFYYPSQAVGAFTAEGKLVLTGSDGVGLSIYNAFPSDANIAADLTIRPIPGGPDDGNNIASAGEILYILRGNENKIIGYRKIPTESEQKPDFAIGSPDIDVNTLATNFFITNPVLATDGKSLFVSSDFHKLYVWKNLPDQNNAYPDFVYSLPDAPWDNVLFGNTLALAGRKTVYIWRNPPLNGELPNDILTDRVGSVQFQELHGVAMDNKYFYLADSQADKVYAFEGVPGKNSEPKFTLSIDQPRRLSSDGKYLVVATTLDNQTGHIKIFTIANLSNGAKPKTLNRDIAPTNLPEDALAAGGSFFIANTAGNTVYAWRNIEDALAGKTYDTILGESSAQDTRPEIGKNKVFWPASLAFDGSFLWVGEFKFSGRILRFSVQK